MLERLRNCALVAAMTCGPAVAASTSFFGAHASLPTAPVAGAQPPSLPQDLSPLFGPPTVQELSAVRADWASRSIVAEGYLLEATGTDATGAMVHIISHLVEGQRHFGAIRFPRLYSSGNVYRTIVLCHGGLEGVEYEQIATFLTALSGGCVDDDAFLVIPSFRGEDLRTSFAGNYASGGQTSFADRDVDDTMSMLSVALQNYPAMDNARISAWGLSRGSAVALLMGVRDDRVRRVVNNFGFTDLSLPSVRARLDEIQNNGVQPVGIGRVGWEAVAQPWLNGALTLAEARLAWIRRSPCYFSIDMPKVQSHHGLSDTQVDVSHTAVLLDALNGVGQQFPDVQAFFYPSGQHSLNSFTGYGDRARDFLCDPTAAPQGYCGPMSPSQDGVYASADYLGTCSRSANDFTFRATGCPANEFGLVIVGSEATYHPSGAGFLCIGAGVQRLGVVQIDGQGSCQLDVDFQASHPLIAPIFDAGTQAHFQVVFRDIGNPMGDFNFSNGLRLTVQP